MKKKHKAKKFKEKKSKKSISRTSEPVENRRPRVGVVVCVSKTDSQEPSLGNLLYGLERGIQATGGDAQRFLTAGFAFSDGDGHSFVFPRRDLLADEVECLVQGAAVDGLVLVADDNEAVAGLLLAAARVNKPAVFVPSRGSVASAEADTRKALSSPVVSVREFLQNGKNVKDAPWTFSGPDNDDYPRHAFSCLTEVLGVSFSGSSTVPSGSPEQAGMAEQAGRRVVELIQQNLSIRRVLMVNAFLNAIRLDAAFGGWPETVIFLSALSQEAGVKLVSDAFSDMGSKTPQICLLSGENGHRLSDLERAGGISAILSGLKGQWLPHTTVSGRGINELAKAGRAKDPKVIRVRSPYRRQGGLVILKGNLAPGGAVMRVPADFSEKSTFFSGVVKVFDSREAALQAILAKKIVRGDAMVIRYEGPKGGPGLRPLGLIPAVLAAQGLTYSVALLTDGLWGAAVDFGWMVEMLTPEATEGTTLSILRDGDRLDIDLAFRRINVHLTDTDTKVRLARWQAPPSRVRNGYLARYVRSVSSVFEGAGLK